MYIIKKRLFLSLLDGPLIGPADILAIGLYIALQKNSSLSVEKFIKDMAGVGTGKLDPNKWGKGESNSGLPENRKIDSKIMKELKRMGLDKKFQNAMEKGLAPRREGTSGIIQLSKNEMITKNGIEYIYKIKVPTAGGHTRVYGYVNDAGVLIFDLLIKK